MVSGAMGLFVSADYYAFQDTSRKIQLKYQREKENVSHLFVFVEKTTLC